MILQYNEEHVGNQITRSQAEKFIDMLNEQKTDYFELDEVEFEYSTTTITYAQTDDLEAIINDLWDKVLTSQEFVKFCEENTRDYIAQRPKDVLAMEDDCEFVINPCDGCSKEICQMQAYNCIYNPHREERLTCPACNKGKVMMGFDHTKHESYLFCDHCHLEYTKEQYEDIAYKKRFHLQL